MKIKLYNKKDYFRNLIPGDVFEAGDELLMKIEKINAGKNEIQLCYNAVGILNGRKLFCEDDEEVILRPDIYVTNECNK